MKLRINFSSIAVFFLAACTQPDSSNESFTTNLQSVSQIAGSDDCERIRAYENAPDEGIERRWVEIHWYGPWWAQRELNKQNYVEITCTHSSDLGSMKFCDWILANSSLEFPYTTPIKVLECYGYKFPRPFPRWEEWRSNIPIITRDNSYSLLEINLHDLEGELGAIRLSVFSGDENEHTKQLPALTELPAPRIKNSQ